MKKLFFLSAIILCLNAAAETVPSSVIKCLSGNCDNGDGEAEMTTNLTSLGGQVYYKGHFKNGHPDGEGIKISILNTNSGGDEYYIGHFRKGYKDGYGVSYRLKVAGGNYLRDAGGIPVADSTNDVFFQDHSGEFAYKGIIVKTDGSTKPYSVYDGKYRKDWDYNKPVNDDWINTNVAAFKAARSGQFSAPQISNETQILARKISNTARDQWIQAIQWDCLTDRKYWIDFEAQTKYHAMPFAGHITIQVVAPDNTVAFEAEAGTYWTPRTAGKYTFLIKFYQDKILGSGAADNYVSGLRIEWSLKSKRQL